MEEKEFTQEWTVPRQAATMAQLRETGSQLIIRTRVKNYLSGWSEVHRSHMAWNMAGRFFNQITISRSREELFNTASNIGLPKNLGEPSNDHILSFGQGL